MACLGTGKIKELGGMRDAFEMVRSRAGVNEGIIRVISKEASGRIAVRHGRFIIGAHIGASGLMGYPALKSFLSLKRGIFYYLEGDEAGGVADLEQSLGVDVTPLLFAEDGRDLLQRFSQMAQENGWDCVTEVYSNLTPSTNMPAYEAGELDSQAELSIVPGPQRFGDTFLDKIAWAAKSTWQRLQKLGKRFDPKVNPNAATVFNDLEQSLVRSKPNQEAEQPTAPRQTHIRAWQLDADGNPVSAPPSSGSGDAVIAPQSQEPLPAVSAIPPSPGSNIPPVPGSNIPPVPGSNIPPDSDIYPTFPSPSPSAESAGGGQGFDLNPMPLTLTPDSFENSTHETLPVSVPVLNAGMPPPPSFQPFRTKPVPEAPTAPGAHIGVQQAQAQPQLQVQRQQEPQPEPQLQLQPQPQSQPEPQTEIPVSSSSHAVYQPEEPAPGSTGQHRALSELWHHKHPQEQAAPTQPLDPSGKHKRMSGHSVEADDRSRNQSERTTESQKLRLIDIDEALQDSAPADGKRKVDLAAVGLGIVTVGLVVVGYFAFTTIKYMSSGNEYLQRASDYLNQGQKDLAVNEYTLGLEKRPHDRRFLVSRAAVYEADNDFDKALKDYQTLLATDAQDTEAALHCAMLDCRLANFTDSLAITNGLITRDPKNADAMALHGIGLAGNGQYKEALGYLDKVPAEAKLSPYLVALTNGARGLASLKIGDPDKALAYYKTALSQQPDSDSLHSQAGQCYLALKDFNSAVQELQQAVKLRPTNSKHYAQLAQAYDDLQQYPNAIKAYKDAINLDRHPGDLYAKIAVDQLKLGRTIDALTACQAALQMVPNQPLALKVQALAEANQRSAKPIAAALAELSTSDSGGAASVNPSNATASKGYKALEQGHYPEAQKLLGQAVKSNPEDNSSRRWLAYAYMRAGDKKAAYDQFAYLALAHALPSADTLTFVDVCQDAGHPEKAIAKLGECLDSHPDWPDARVKLIRACLAAGLKERASTVAEEGIYRAASDDEKRRYHEALSAAPSK